MHDSRRNPLAERGRTIALGATACSGGDARASSSKSPLLNRAPAARATVQRFPAAAPWVGSSGSGSLARAKHRARHIRGPGLDVSLDLQNLPSPRRGAEQLLLHRLLPASLEPAQHRAEVTQTGRKRAANGGHEVRRNRARPARDTNTARRSPCTARRKRACKLPNRL